MDRQKLERFIGIRLLVSITAVLLLVQLLAGPVSSFRDIHLDGGGRMEISLKESLQTSQTPKVMLEDMKTVKKEFPKGEVSCISELDTAAETNRGIERVRVGMTTETYQDFTVFHMLKGSFFTGDACKYGRNVAVISDQLAYKLFASYNIIGREITLFDHQVYKVTGVYKRNSSILSFFGFDGMDRVYIPFQSDGESGTIPVKTLLIRDLDQKKEMFGAEKISELLGASLKVQPEDYRVNDDYKAVQLLEQPGSILIFLLGLMDIVLLLRFFFRYRCWFPRHFKKAAEKEYFLKALWSQKMRFAALLGVLAFFILCCLLIFQCTRFQFYLPARFIPPDNVFDFGFYLDRIREIVQSQNPTRGYIPSLFELDFQHAMVMNLLLCGGILLVLLSLRARLKLACLIQIPFTFFLRALAIALPVSMLLYVSVSLLFGMPIALSGSPLVICIAFVLLYWVSRNDSALLIDLHQ